MKLKNIVITTIVCMMTICAAAQNKGYTISGNIKDLPDGITFYLINGKDTVDQVKSKSQQFMFKGVLEEEGVVLFVKIDTSIIKRAKKDAIGKRVPMAVRLLLDNSGEIVKVTGSLKNWPEIDIDGAELTQEHAQFEKNINAAREQANAKIEALEMDSSKIIEVKKGYKMTYIGELKKISGSNVVPIVLFHNESLDTEIKDSIYQRFSKRQKASYYGKRLKQRIIGEKASKSIGIGKVIPDFEVKIYEGKLESIRKLAMKSKYTLIDFWAHWCKPCRADIPNLKKVYKTFNSKGFNILSISIDPSIENWHKALKEENTLWINGMQVGSPSKDIFGLISIPAYILLNDKAEIVQMDLNSSFFSQSAGTLNGSQVFIKDSKKKGLRGDDLYQVMEGLLGKPEINK